MKTANRIGAPEMRMLLDAAADESLQTPRPERGFPVSALAAGATAAVLLGAAGLGAVHLGAQPSPDREAATSGADSGHRDAVGGGLSSPRPVARMTLRQVEEVAGVEIRDTDVRSATVTEARALELVQGSAYSLGLKDVGEPINASRGEKSSYAWRTAWVIVSEDYKGGGSFGGRAGASQGQSRVGTVRDVSLVDSSTGAVYFSATFSPDECGC